MSSHASTGIERKIEHAFFLLSVWSKGVAGLLETIGGLLLLFIPHTGLNALVVFLTAPELAEDPTDRIATLLQRMVHELSADTKLFASGYLIRSRHHQSFPGRGAVEATALVISGFALVPGRLHRLSSISLFFHSLALDDRAYDCRSSRRVLNLA